MLPPSSMRRPQTCRPRRMWRRMGVVIGIAAGFYLAALVALFVFQRSRLYVPNTGAPSLAEAGLEGVMESVQIKTADGLRLLSWYRAPSSSNPGLVVVCFHGNAGHIGHRGDRVRPYLDAGYGVLVVEYRGIGGNPGQPPEPGLYAHPQAAGGFRGRRGFPPTRIIF